MTAALAGTLVGFLIGVAYFLALWRAVGSLARTRAPGSPYRLVAAAGARLVLVSGLVAVLLHLDVGAPALLCGALGFLAARSAATALARGRDRSPRKPSP